MSWERGPADGVGQQDVRASGRIKRFAFHAVLWSLGLVSLALVAAGLFEANTSVFESKVFSRLGSRLTFKVASGENSGIQFPSGGPQDKRLGYSQLPGYLKSLKARNYLVTRQAAWSPELEKFTAENGYAMYREKENAGLVLRDHTGASFYRTSYPERVFAEFRAVPPLVVETLLFIEDLLLLHDAVVPPQLCQPHTENDHDGHSQHLLHALVYEEARIGRLKTYKGHLLP